MSSYLFFLGMDGQMGWLKLVDAGSNKILDLYNPTPPGQAHLIMKCGIISYLET